MPASSRVAQICATLELIPKSNIKLLDRAINLLESNLAQICANLEFSQPTRLVALRSRWRSAGEKNLSNQLQWFDCWLA
jgi:hypothetical protein